MALRRNIASGLRSLFRKKQVSQELDEELNGFLEIAAEGPLLGRQCGDALQGFRRIHKRTRWIEKN
jgi:plasmid stabilization system protein ParE